MNIDELQHDFLWGGVGDEFEFHFVNWTKICEPTQCGGLGIRNLLTFNQALLGKWLRWFAMEREALWQSMLEKNYGCIWDTWA